MAAAAVARNATGVKAEELRGGEIGEVIPVILLGIGKNVAHLEAERSCRRCCGHVSRCGDDIAGEYVVRPVLLHKLADECAEIIPLRNIDEDAVTRARPDHL